MKVLFAVSNDKMSETIIKQYEKQYKEIINYKNVYYFNAILKELQRDKTYDRIVISEDLEQYASSDHEQMDNFIFGRLDGISDEASNVKGEDIPIILICEERRVKGEELLAKLFGIGIYNAIIGADRSINEVCRLINRPRSKKEAKIYYKIDSEDVLYEKNDENEVSELEIQNILAHYTMGERPMTIRYLDPPLHEFLPTKDEDIKELAADMGMTFEDLKNVVASLHEFNPMMGHRGCRLAVTYPEIAAMQTRAVIKAALNVSAETGYMITPHIMIPLVGEVKELKFVKDVVVKVADELIAAAGVDMKYQVGTMIEIPRAALTAGEIAKEAEFFSFGTNDLTQMTFGFSRDDAAKFLGAYYENKIYESDPFQHLDQIGVGKLVKMAAHDGRETRPDLGLGICGEHGGDPTSVEFCHNVGLDYVSCSPFRVPIARLAAAQAAIKNPRK